MGKDNMKNVGTFWFS